MHQNAAYTSMSPGAEQAPPNKDAGPGTLDTRISDTPARNERGGIKLRILLPFTALLIFVIGVFLTSTYLAEKRLSRAELSEYVLAAQRLLQHEVEEDASMMHGTLDAITQDTALMAAMVAGDREGILRQVRPLFKALKQDHGISHFYFIGPDRKVLLRLHRPDVYGDTVDRATTLRAERTRRIAYGIELGRLGSLTLRAVVPWRDGERIIGYVELGHDIGHFVEEISQILDVEILAIVYKKFLERAGWETGSATRERPWPWDQLRTIVSVARTMDDFPIELKPLLEEGQHPYETVLSMQDHGQRAHVAFLPLLGTAGQEIGDLVIIRDVTREQASFHNSFMLTVALSVTTGGAVFVLFLVTLRRVERDYRQKREVEAQFSKLTREHERIVQVEKLSALGMMIGEIAHQINNPLVGVVNMAQLAKREVGDPIRTNKLLGDIVDAGKHCHAFVKRMVEFTKISRSEYESVEIRKLIGDTIFLFRQSAKRHPPVITDFPETQVILDVDPIMIRHALFNLLSNAAQANAEMGRGTITVRLFREAREKDTAGGWCIAVEDQGPGISEDIQKHIFTPFFTTRPEGTGLGLPVVQYVAKLHGGHISGGDKPGGGACFSLWLPDSPPEEEHETQDSNRR